MQLRAIVRHAFMPLYRTVQCRVIALDRMSFQVGDLVRIQGLQSEQGQQLNGSLGKVVSCANPPRLGVKLYSKPTSSSTQDRLRVIVDAANIKSFSASNLALHDSCCPLYIELCLHIIQLSLSRRVNMKAGACA